jgi:hypothetical protein
MFRVVDFLGALAIVSALSYACFCGLRFAASCPRHAAIARGDELEFHDKK